VIDYLTKKNINEYNHIGTTCITCCAWYVDPALLVQAWDEHGQYWMMQLVRSAVKSPSRVLAITSESETSEIIHMNGVFFIFDNGHVAVTVL
jgi:hypothetical protein